MSEHTQQSWWKQILIGVLAIVFGICAIVFPARIMMGRLLDDIFGGATPLSASMTAVAALLVLVAMVAIDAVVNLFGTGVMDKRRTRIRGAIGAAVLLAAISWPGKTAYVAVELIGLWAIAVGVLELMYARYSHEDKKSRALIICAAIASMALGVGIMVWVFVAAVAISVLVGLAAMARGVSLMMTGISDRLHQDDEAPAFGGKAA